MPRRDFSDVASELGFEVGRNDNAMFHFGVSVATAAAQGLVLPEDADMILEAFWQGRRKGRGEPRLAAPPSRVQASKLRTFIKVGSEMKQAGVEMLTSLAEHVHDPVAYGGLYNVAIDVCREALNTGRPLKPAEVKKMFP